MTPAEWPWMRRALALAERGRGYVEPNPLVGAVVVREGELVGEGWHERFGEAHAEIKALAAAGEAARGATLYVTLEPCCHQGKTPPCTQAIIRAGVARVIASIADPFPEVCGRGVAHLRDAGIDIDIGLGETEARRLNAPYLKLLSTGRPYVHAKWAMSLDGKIATRSGESKWITGEASRRRGHELRGRMDAVIIGSGTAMADDPMLTARPPGPRTACRILLCSRGDAEMQRIRRLHLVKTAREIPTLIVGVRPNKQLDELASLGCEVAILAAAADGRIAVPALLDHLGHRRFTNVMVEGGAQVLGSFRDAGQIEEIHVFIAARLIGGGAALSPLAARGAESLRETLDFF